MNDLLVMLQLMLQVPVVTCSIVLEPGELHADHPHAGTLRRASLEQNEKGEMRLFHLSNLAFIVCAAFTIHYF